jgi:DNA-directed RNA polymerase specialized sigma24 family protein
MIITPALLLLLIPLSAAYLDTKQISYVRNILTHPHTSEYMRNQTQEVLFDAYKPWLHKQVRFFREKHHASNRVCDDLYHYAALGLLQSIQKFDGKSSLVKYAEKYVDGQLRLGLLEMTPMKPLNHYQTYIKHYKILKPGLVSYENYWVFDKEWTRRQNAHCESKYRDEVETIIKIVLSMPSKYSTVFFSRYDYVDLSKKDRTVASICSELGFSTETYRKRMRTVKQFIKYRLDRKI